jgi:hypothetical protein
VREVREEARRAKKESHCSLIDDEIEQINGDTDWAEQAGDNGKKEIEDEDGQTKCLVLLKLWRDSKTETIWMRKSTKQYIIYEDTDTELSLYPLAHMQWEPVKGSFFGWSDVTGMIPNQQYINKIAAMMMMHTMYSAFPKMVYDADKIDDPSNQIGVAIGIKNAGSQSIRNIVDYITPASMSADAFNMFNSTIQQTRELMGAGDSALGLVNPESASGKAIMATVEASATPLESNRRRFYNYIEDCARIWFDIWTTHNDQNKTFFICSFQNFDYINYMS